ncbi:MAG: hypothetical protein JWO74_1739 [Solirubrobacterales bacterium]|nr:hypothetical protein [Solirubrobacterales bacterium]
MAIRSTFPSARKVSVPTTVGRGLAALTPARVLAGVIAVTVAVSAFIAITTPAWEANDERDHVLNTEVLASGHWYRLNDPNSGFEAHQAPAYYLLLAGYQRYVLGLPARFPDPHLAAYSGGFIPQIFQHDVPPDGADQRHLVPLRLISVLLGALTVLFTALAARKVTRDPWTPVVAAGFVAFVPKFLFLSGVVNNDNLSNAFGALGLFVALSGIAAADSATTRQRMAITAALGGVLGVLVLSKLTATTLALALVIPVLLLGRDLRERARLGAIFGIVALSVCGWWLVQNQVRYGDPLASQATHDHLRALFPPLFQVPGIAQAVLHDTPKIVFRSFWYTSGYNQYYWQSSLPYWLLWGGLATGLVGLARRRVWLGVPRGTLLVLWAAVLAGAAAIWTLGVQTTTTQARVGFFALPAVGVLFALGWQRWQAKPLFRFVLPIAGLALALVAVQRDILSVYPN